MKLRIGGFWGLLVFGFWNCSLVFASDQPVEIPFKLYGGHAIVVRGAIGQLENLNFLVDTGAVPSVINRRLANKLNLRGQRDEISVFSKNAAVERVGVADLRIGGVSFASVSAVAIDLAQIENGLGVRLDAILGLDVLGRQDFTIDYQQHKLIFGAADSAGATAGFELRSEAGAPYIVVRLEVQGEPLRLLLDTGSHALTLFAARIAGRLPVLQNVRADRAVNAGGEYAAQQIRISEARIGSAVCHNVPASVMQTAEGGLRDFDGMLGPAALGIKRISFDFARRVLIIQGLH